MFGTSTRLQGKVLVVYYSVSGNTARVARDIAMLMRADLEALRDERQGSGCMAYIKAVVDAIRQTPIELGPLSKHPREYALIVVGTPVWAWKMTPAVRAYLQRVRPDLGKVAFFVTSGDTDVSKIAPAMEEVSGCHPIACAGFNAEELANTELYREKLDTFVRAMKDAPDRIDQSSNAFLNRGAA
jgi:flavodoxin